MAGHVKEWMASWEYLGRLCLAGLGVGTLG